ncbi:SDR family NAD(P)-dependent oxidoreductase [Fulvivirga sedimenti]|uniref:SDR family NAD(P)-dependent oxidoreductase n=1 Tax=Fulvivirga sedimenti TaxID=2879465 RepID=A0A9X1HWZ2_9BACT|nr:SDR family NAD(P)-dependent oxidoreductase [Fulvivirga sedimenti]MCA6077999.1 SDR family NAD(P)-dependent oxidoreductase [Fulvivirga sedimenti]
MTFKTAFITGATSGIGKATAEILADQGYKLILCGRRADRLERLKEELPTEVHTLTFDVRNQAEVDEAVATLPDHLEIDVLINNAGNAHGMAPLQSGDVADWDAMIDINVKGLLYVTRAVLPGMIDRNNGYIINIGSIAGKEVYPSGNVYCASKHAVDAINQGLRIDLNGTGIKVSAINPGLVETEFSMVRFKGDEDRSRKVYAGMDALQARDIAEIIAFMLSRPAHVNLADILVLPQAQASSTIVSRK